MISAGHHAAAHAGFAILEAGGNAIDAGVAAGMAVEVLQTDRVNFAGVAPILIYWAEQKRVINIDGLGTWPRAVTPDYFMKHHAGKIPPGLLRTIVPAAPDAWITALEQYGTMSFGDVAAAAISFARDGFPMHAFMADYIRSHEKQYRRWPSTAEVFLPNGQPPVVGELFVQRDLARTIQYMADEEKTAATKDGRAAGLNAARAAFYSGDIAATIVKYHKDNGGLLSADDMSQFRVRFEKPLRTTYSGVELYACGPWCQGPVLPQALSVLAGYDLRTAGHNTPEYIHLVTEALKLAFADRHRYYGDPNFVDVPMDTLLSPEYAARRRQLIRPGEAWPGLPPAGNADSTIQVKLPKPTRGEPAPAADTSYVCAIDRFGKTSVSARPTIV